MLRIVGVFTCLALVAAIIPAGCDEPEFPDMEVPEPRDRLVEILQLTDNQVEQLEAGTGTLKLREDQVDTLRNRGATLLDDLEPWIDESRWQEVKGILESMLTEGEVDFEALDPVAEAIHGCLMAMVESDTGVETYTSLRKLSADSVSWAGVCGQLAEESDLSTAVIIYTPVCIDAGHMDFYAGVTTEHTISVGGTVVPFSNHWSGVVGVHTDVELDGGAIGYAGQSIVIHVPADNTDMTVKATVLHAGGALTYPWPAPAARATTEILAMAPYRDPNRREVAVQRWIERPFGWGDALSLALMIVGPIAGGVQSWLATGAESLLTLNDVLDYELALRQHGKQEVVVHTARSLSEGLYIFEVGVQATAIATLGVASAFIFGMVPEIEVTLEIPPVTLDITSTEGGAVTEPGEGRFTYPFGEPVILLVEADEDYQFTNWTGDVETLGDMLPPMAVILMHGNYSIKANFEQDVGEKPAYFACPNLEEAIREAIAKPTGDIYPADLKGLTELDASRRDIVDLTGLEYCTDLTLLYLYGNEISDISPLAGLIDLTKLSLTTNHIVNISPLADLTNLRELYLSDNQISSISALANLAGLTDLCLGYNRVVHVSPLASLTNLVRLGLCCNQISDMSSLSSLTTLEMLSIEENQIRDASTVVSLTNLDTLWLADNPIGGISYLANLTKLAYLGLGNTQISDISALTHLVNLEYVELQDNQISDISPLVDNPGLGGGDYVELRDNPLSAASRNTYIPELEARGVWVNY